MSSNKSLFISFDDGAIDPTYASADESDRLFGIRGVESASLCVTGFSVVSYQSYGALTTFTTILL
jgi:hypothetical protein